MSRLWRIDAMRSVESQAGVPGGSGASSSLGVQTQSPKIGLSYRPGWSEKSAKMEENSFGSDGSNLAGSSGGVRRWLPLVGSSEASSHLQGGMGPEAEAGLK